MSSPPTRPISPYEPVTTPTIDLSNRLLSLRSHPAYLDLIRISQQMVLDAGDVSASYPGWDTQQMVVLKVRHQAAKEHHTAFFAKINEAIQAGIEEARSSTLPTKTATEVLEQGDYVRQQVLQKFDDADLRVAGSF